MIRWSVLVIIAAAAGCGAPRTFHCTTSTQCGGTSVCIMGVCANQSADCASGLRFDGSAGSGLAGQCVMQSNGAALGTACGGDGECASGHCVSGVCCASSCDPDGQPCGPDGTCGADGACHYAPAGTVCGAQSCSNGTLTQAAVCDGQGSCLPANTRPCTPYQCLADGSDCASKCDATNTCVAPNVCTNGSCGLAPAGAKCAGPGDCQSGHCSDGTCCDSDCAGACMSCNVTGKVGTCSPVPAGSSDPHGICADQGVTTCGHDGYCNGTGGCEYYAAGSVCSPAKCLTGGYQSAGTCPGGGAACSGATGYYCGGGAYNCYMYNGAPKCFDSCGGCLSGGPYPSNCAPGYTCVKPTCMPGDLIYYCK